MKINKLIVPLLGLATLTNTNQQEVVYSDEPQTSKTAKLIMNNCPLTHWTTGGDWASFGCIAHLSQFGECLNLWYRKRERKVYWASFQCPVTEIDTTNSVIYACPANTEVGDGLWASFGCVGQLSFMNECENIWWNDGPKSKKFACDRFDFSGRNFIYKCPYDTTVGSVDIWASIGCIGQYSHTGNCFNVWWNGGSHRPDRYYRNCEVLYIPSKEGIQNDIVADRKVELQEQQALQIQPAYGTPGSSNPNK